MDISVLYNNSDLSFEEKVDLVNTCEYETLRAILSDYVKNPENHNHIIKTIVCRRLWEYEYEHCTHF